MVKHNDKIRTLVEPQLPGEEVRAVLQLQHNPYSTVHSATAGTVGSAAVRRGAKARNASGRYEQEAGLDSAGARARMIGNTSGGWTIATDRRLLQVLESTMKGNPEMDRVKFEHPIADVRLNWIDTKANMTRFRVFHFTLGDGRWFVGQAFTGRWVARHDEADLLVEAFGQRATNVRPEALPSA